MVVVASEIGLFLSGGSSNEEPTQSLGGPISSVQIVDDGMNNVWDDVTGFQAQIGLVQYRLFYIKNLNATDTFGSVRAWISQQNSFTENAGTTRIAIGNANAGLNVLEPPTANQGEAPNSVDFVEAKTLEGSIGFGNIPPTQIYGIWIRRTILTDATPTQTDYYNLRIQGLETTTL